jgi:hypothetical protein
MVSQAIPMLAISWTANIWKKGKKISDEEEKNGRYFAHKRSIQWRNCFPLSSSWLCSMRTGVSRPPGVILLA